MFGSDICTCRPYLIYGIEEAVKEAQKGGSGGEYNKFHFKLPISNSVWIFLILYSFGTWNTIWTLKSVHFLCNFHYSLPILQIITDSVVF